MTTPSDTALTANAHRISNARCALNSASLSRGEEFDCPFEALIDLLVDLRHFCAARRIDFRTCADIAAIRYHVNGGGAA